MKLVMRKGFTLTEIMIVAAILGMIAVIAIPNFARAKASSEASACIANQKQIESSVQVWAIDNGRLGDATPTSDELVPDYIKKWPNCRNVAYAIPSVSSAPSCPNSIAAHALNQSGSGGSDESSGSTSSSDDTASGGSDSTSGGSSGRPVPAAP